MTAPEKTKLTHLFDTMDDFLRDGYVSVHPEYSFADDVFDEEAEAIHEKKAENHSMQYVEDSSDSVKLLESIAGEIKTCTLCGLCETRTMAVPGEGAVPTNGNNYPLVMVIGEGPGADEDKSGRPFVGKAGQLLDKMLGSIGLYRDKNCFIANVVKCRPPNNRDPLPEETSACREYLSRQIQILKPKIILSVGRIPTQILLNTSEGITKLRGKFTEYNGIPFMPTFHPSALLRDDNLKRPAWEDLKLLRKFLIDTDDYYAQEAKQENNV
jgi:DNA polymerase